MELFSTRYSENCNCKKLDMNLMPRYSCNARTITILSAYYSINFLKTILKAVPKDKRKKCKLILVFNGFRGNRLKSQRDELKEFSKEIKRNKFEEFSIYLNMKTTLFHTKLYKFELSKNPTIWFIGSANASEQAFTTNEELLIQITGEQTKLENYITTIINSSILIEDVNEPIINNLIAFWRTGLIYSKPNTQIQFSFNELKMPDHVRNKLGNVRDIPRHTTPGNVWGPFNIKMIIGMHEPQDTDEDSSDEEGKHILIGRWSIETSLGFWVPSTYSSQLMDKIIEVGNRKKIEFQSISQKLNSFGSENIIQEYKEYLTEINQILEDNNISNWHPKNNLLSRFKKYLKRLLNRLNNEKYIERASHPLLPTFMPEIWSDSLATEDFKESFFSSLEYKLHLSPNSLVAHSISKAVKLTSIDDPEIISKKLQTYLKKSGWPDQRWLHKIKVDK